MLPCFYGDYFALWNLEQPFIVGAALYGGMI